MSRQVAALKRRDLPHVVHELYVMSLSINTAAEIRAHASHVIRRYIIFARNLLCYACVEVLIFGTRIHALIRKHKCVSITDADVPG